MNALVRTQTHMAPRSLRWRPDMATHFARQLCGQTPGLSAGPKTAGGAVRPGGGCSFLSGLLWGEELAVGAGAAGALLAQQRIRPRARQPGPRDNLLPGHRAILTILSQKRPYHRPRRLAVLTGTGEHCRPTGRPLGGRRGGRGRDGRVLPPVLLTDMCVGGVLSAVLVLVLLGFGRAGAVLAGLLGVLAAVGDA